MNEILNIFGSIIKSFIIAILIVIVSFIIEKATKLKLLIDDYNWKKSPRNADASSTRDAGNYFILNLLVLIYDIYKGHLEFQLISIIIWLILVVFLTKIFYQIHRKYQAVDIGKSDDDYSD